MEQEDFDYGNETSVWTLVISETKSSDEGAYWCSITGDGVHPRDVATLELYLQVDDSDESTK